MFRRIITWFKSIFKKKVKELPPPPVVEEKVVVPRIQRVKKPENVSLIEELGAAYKISFIDHPKLKNITMAQWILESGWGRSELAKEHFNFGGLKWRGSLGIQGVNKISYMAHDGRTDYAKCDSIETYIQYYWKFLGRSVYVGWELYRNNPVEFMKYISKAGYNPDPRYPSDVLALVPEAGKLLS